MTSSDGQFTSAMAVDNNTVRVTSSDGQFTSAMAMDNTTVGVTSSDGQFISAMAMDNNTVGVTSSDGHGGIYPLGKTHFRSAPSLRSWSEARSAAVWQLAFPLKWIWMR